MFSSLRPNLVLFLQGRVLRISAQLDLTPSPNSPLTLLAVIVLQCPKSNEKLEIYPFGALIVCCKSRMTSHSISGN